jgi:hypothetical protein
VERASYGGGGGWLVSLFIGGKWVCTLPEDIGEQIVRDHAQAAQVAGLQEALGRYGWHRDRCPAYEGDDVPCDCGWEDALAAQGEPEEGG